MRWNVAFMPKDRPTHCFAFRPEVDGQWVIVDRALGSTEVRLLHAETFARWVRILAPRATILDVECGPGRAWQLGSPCVAEVKRLIGSRSGALFPGGLRADLLASGARRAFGT